MTPDIIFGVIVGAFMGGAVAANIGYGIGRGKRTPIKTEDIMDYVRDNFGSEYDAYRKGISEGYQQGLRDAEMGDGT